MHSGIVIRLKAACRSSDCAKNISQRLDLYAFDAKYPTAVIRERRPTRMIAWLDGEPGQPVGMSPNVFTYFKPSMMEHGEWDDIPNDEVDGGLRTYAHMRLCSLAYGDYTSDLVAFYLKGLWNRACEIFEPEVSNIMPRKLIKQLGLTYPEVWSADTQKRWQVAVASLTENLHGWDVSQLPENTAAVYGVLSMTSPLLKA